MKSFVERVGKETEGAAIKGVSRHARLWDTVYLKSQGTANTLGHSSTSFVDFLPVIVPLHVVVGGHSVYTGEKAVPEPSLKSGGT